MTPDEKFHWAMGFSWGLMAALIITGIGVAAFTYLPLFYRWLDSRTMRRNFAEQLNSGNTVELSRDPRKTL